jgi:hypothetical protein
MTEMLVVFFAITIVVAAYAIWKSAWHVAPPSPPTVKTNYGTPIPYSDLNNIAKNMQNNIFYGTSRPKIGISKDSR